MPFHSFFSNPGWVALISIEPKHFLSQGMHLTQQKHTIDRLGCHGMLCKPSVTTTMVETRRTYKAPELLKAHSSRGTNH